MAGDKQPKTKAELLRELQSIQHLLNEPEDEQFPALDDDDIPLLDAFLDEDEESELAHDLPLASDKETLDALNAAYAALTGDLDQSASDKKHNTYEKTPEKKPPQQPVAQTAPRANAPSHLEQTKQTHQSAPSYAEPRPHEPEDRDEFSQAADFGFELVDPDELDLHHDEFDEVIHTDPSAPAPLPGQQSLFEPIKKAEAPAANTNTNAEKEAHSVRPAQVTKASGENPFLPQHIRERLRGNQPLPQGEFLLPTTPPAYMDLAPHPQTESPAAKAPKHEAATHEKASSDSKTQGNNSTVAATSKSPKITAIIDDVIDEFLPLIEARLRKRLAQALNDEEPTEH